MAWQFEFEVIDVIYDMTKHGNLVPSLLLKFEDDEYVLGMPNMYSLIKSGLMIGDTFVKSPNSPQEILSTTPGEDRSPPIIPTHCPCCGDELSVTTGRHSVFKCLNVKGCSVQLKGA